MEKPGELYPGSQATAASLLLLAHEYRRSADILLASGRKGIAASYAPFRLTAIHAIELYLNAFLLHSGETPERIRALATISNGEPNAQPRRDSYFARAPGRTCSHCLERASTSLRAMPWNCWARCPNSTG